jgi:hypothetical protein
MLHDVNLAHLAAPIISVDQREGQPAEGRLRVRRCQQPRAAP